MLRSTWVATPVMLGLGLLVGCGSIQPTATPATTSNSAATPTPAATPTEEAVTVKRVIDGDSLELVVDDEEVEVRLLGINAPELYTLDDVETCGGSEAENLLMATIGGASSIGFLGGDRDRFGRLLGVVSVDGVPVTHTMVEAGWALALWSGGDPDLIEAMLTASEAGRGMWGDTCGAPASRALSVVGDQVDAPGDDRENLAEEWVTVTNDGSTTVDLDGWTIRDETTSNRFLLDAVTLAAGESVRVHSGSGSATSTDYYLGEGFPVWSNRGETVLLVDPAGVVAAHDFVPPR